MTRFAPLVLALAGLILFGHGAYIHAKALLAQVLLERAFAMTVATGYTTKPWSWADTWPVARIEIKRLHVGAIVLAGSSGQALAFGPGHVEQTADAGERGVTVYAAHRDTHFRFLKNVAELVLSTCWPFDAVTGGPERYLVHATMIEPGL
jgi:sortase A